MQANNNTNMQVRKMQTQTSKYLFLVFVVEGAAQVLRLETAFYFKNILKTKPGQSNGV